MQYAMNNNDTVKSSLGWHHGLDESKTTRAIHYDRHENGKAGRCSTAQQLGTTGVGGTMTCRVELRHDGVSCQNIVMEM